MRFDPAPICRHCGVESFDARIHSGLNCPICSDERQYPDPNGQVWLNANELSDYRVDIRQIGKGAYALSANPNIGIGHTGYLLQSDQGWILWDPLPIVDGGLAWQGEDLSSSMEGLTIAASHPHMFGAQSSWASEFKGTVLVNEEDVSWVDSDRFSYQYWSRRLRIDKRAEIVTMGGHFPGSSYLYWESEDGEVWLFASDTTQIRPNGRFSFQWSYPNMLPLGANEVNSMLGKLPEYLPTRAFDNFGRTVRGNIREKIVLSGEKHIQRILS